MLVFKQIFTIAPGALALFSFKDEPNLYESASLKKHGIGVMKAVNKCVIGDIKGLNGLGKRHVKRGVIKDHYEVVGQAILNTLKSVFDQDWPKYEEAWIAMFTALAKEMQRENY